MLERYLHIRLKDEIRFRRFLRTKKSCHNPFNVRHQEQAYGQSRPVDLDFFIEMEDEESVLNYDPKRGGRIKPDKQNQENKEEKKYYDFNRKSIRSETQSNCSLFARKCSF